MFMKPCLSPRETIVRIRNGINIRRNRIINFREIIIAHIISFCDRLASPFFTFKVGV